MTDLEVYLNTKGFLLYLSRAGKTGPKGRVLAAGDLRPSTERILKAAFRAVRDSGWNPDYLGTVPTPALTFAGICAGVPSLMVTGSHIPFDRNGIKFNRPDGEILKSDEAGILSAVEEVRREEYLRESNGAVFDRDGMFRRSEELPAVNPEGRDLYRRRYLEGFPRDGFRGKRILFYQHSSVGRDLIPEILSAFGAQVDTAGRSDRFVPIDTENIRPDRLNFLQGMMEEESRKRSVSYDALVSTDGDGDRPMLLGTDGGRVRFFGGDLVGAVAADYLGAEAAAVPVSANDAVDRYLERVGIRLVKTKIGSPYVIQSMKEIRRESPGKKIVSWEANGGFLTGTDLALHGNVLKALPTRDALLPILAALFSAWEKDLSVSERFSQLPRRYGASGLVDNFPSETGRRILDVFSPEDRSVTRIRFGDNEIRLEFGGEPSRIFSPDDSGADGILRIRELLRSYFSPAKGYGAVSEVNYIDGLRITFANGDVAHIRPSGNAPQMRVYACADSPERADAIVNHGLEEPGGILFGMRKSLGG